MRVASDVGGTFTDLVYWDESTGRFGSGKVSTTPRDFAAGIVETLQKARLSVPATAFFVHGSTVVINALTERTGARTGLITTKGFRDVLEIARANRPDLYNLCYRKPRPFVPRQFRLEVRERLSHKGEELAPLEEGDVRKAVEYFLREGIQAVAVCLLHSYANPEHERRCREIIQELAPETPVTLSCEITREWREYERSNTCVLNSYVLPASRQYLESLERQLSTMGMGNVFYVMQSNGGTATFAAGKHAPIRLVESGPVGGVIGASVVGRMLGEANVISLDVGGTTAKTSLLQGGEPRITTEYKIEWRRDFAGYPVLVPTVDIVEIGAGGGSLAWVDGGGALRVGPASAGADPGPASYGRGGERPTVTDANVLAGRINPRYFLGGEIPLHVELAERAMQPIAAGFGLSVEEAAMGVIRLADSSMINALKLVSVQRGYDPRDFVLVAFGGGGAMHAGALIRELRVKKALIPTNPAVFSAWGMLAADLRQDFIRTLIRSGDRFDALQLESSFAEMEAEAGVLLRGEGIAEERIAFQRFVDARYAGQEHTVKVPVSGGKLGERNIAEINESFHRLHEQAYGFHLDSPVELVNCHLTALGVTQKPQMKRIEERGLRLEKALKGRRRVNFDELGFHECPIYERDLLPVGEAVQGPLVIEEPAATTVVFPDQSVTRDEYGFLHLEGCSKP